MARLARRKMLVLAGGAGVWPLLVGCGQDPTGKAYTVGCSPDAPPFDFVDPTSNKPTGAMVDIVQAVTKDAGLKVRIEIVPFAEMIPSLTAHKIDLTCTALLRTPAREQVVSFTNPIYALGGAVLLPAEDSRSCQNLSALVDLTVGVESSSRFVTQLEEAGVTSIKPYATFPEVIRAVHDGQIQAGYGAYAIVAYYLRTEPDLKVRVATDFAPPLKEELCLITRKNDFELIARLNVSIERLRAREIQAILERWGLV